MDVQYPYANGLARQHLLYRLAAVPAPRRLLLVYAERTDKSIASSWDGPAEVIAGPKLISFAKRDETGFDAVALPQVLGSPPAPANEILQAAHRLLAPGGFVIGHVEHLLALRRLASVGGLCRWALSASGRNGIGTPARCLRELARAGFTQAECYYVYPSIDAPLALIPCHHGPARQQFLRAIRSSPNQYGRLSYLLRLMAASVGLGGMQQPQLFFWAGKPC